MEDAKICLLIPDGVGIRNYLYSDIIEYFSEKELIIWHTLPPEVIAFAENYHQKKLAQIPWTNFRETKLQKYLRESARFARLHQIAEVDKNESAWLYWRPQKKTKLHKAYNLITEATGKWASKKYSRIVWLENKSFENIRKSDAYFSAKKIIVEQNITSILCTHQRSADALPVMLAAIDLGIENYCAIFSWDNLPKSTLFCRATKYLVWSNYMKDEIIKYYPEIETENIIITGTPQFDFYKKKDWILTREDFCKLLNIDPNKKIILYSGNDWISTTYDQDYLEDLCKVIDAMPLKDRPALVFRPVPVEPPTRYLQVLDKYKHIVTLATPLWKSSTDGWHLFYPTIDDVKLLVNYAYHCCGVINVGSTMALDFTMFNKPAIYFKYNHNKPYPIMSITDAYKLQHFRSMDGLNAVAWVMNVEDILPVINRMLNQPESIGPEKEKWRKKIVGNHENVSENIAEILKSRH